MEKEPEGQNELNDSNDQFSSVIEFPSKQVDEVKEVQNGVRGSLRQKIMERLDVLSDREMSIVKLLEYKVNNLTNLIKALQIAIHKILKERANKPDENTSAALKELIEYNDNKYNHMLEKVKVLRSVTEENNNKIEGLWKQFKKIRESGSMVFQQNKVLKEALTKYKHEKLTAKSIALKMIYIERDVDKQKQRVIVDQMKKGGNAIIEFSEEPITDENIIILSNLLLEMHIKNFVHEVTISNGYTKDMMGVFSLIKQNSGVLKSLTITNTLLDTNVAIKLLETLAVESVVLDKLNLDQNRFEERNLGLLIKPFLNVKVRYFSIKKNKFTEKSIEKFCEATMYLSSLEVVNVGKMKISEQKELIWKTDFKKLRFERKVLNSIDYKYI